MLDEDLTEFEKQGKLFYMPVVQAKDDNWNMASGKITKEMIDAFMPPSGRDDSLILVCGSKKLKEEVAPLLSQFSHCYYFA
mmetsp:Transcript_43070/g.31447  ORF Transcript_43070/g.31447 Transcript_43070/m.31447 type:complete len:81 (+) Transcript_43070:614-856(+)